MNRNQLANFITTEAATARFATGFDSCCYPVKGCRQAMVIISGDLTIRLLNMGTGAFGIRAYCQLEIVRNSITLHKVFINFSEVMTSDENTIPPAYSSVTANRLKSSGDLVASGHQSLSKSATPKVYELRVQGFMLAAIINSVRIDEVIHYYQSRSHKTKYHYPNPVSTSCSLAELSSDHSSTDPSSESTDCPADLPAISTDWATRFVQPPSSMTPQFKAPLTFIDEFPSEQGGRSRMCTPDSKLEHYLTLLQTMYQWAPDVCLSPLCAGHCGRAFEDGIGPINTSNSITNLDQTIHDDKKIKNYVCDPTAKIHGIITETLTTGEVIVYTLTECPGLTVDPKACDMLVCRYGSFEYRWRGTLPTIRQLRSLVNTKAPVTKLTVITPTTTWSHLFVY